MQSAMLVAAVLFGFTYTCSARKVKGILLAGGSSGTSQVELFDPNSGSTVLPIELGHGEHLLAERSGHAITTSDKGVVSVYGGVTIFHEKTSGALREALRSSEYYDSVSEKWHVGPDMIQERVFFDMAVYDGELYAIGGWGGAESFETVEQFNSVEKFDTSLNKFVWAKHNLTAPKGWHCALPVDVECPAQ